MNMSLDFRVLILVCPLILLMKKRRGLAQTERVALP
jgi:hypothetical protein